MLCIVARHDDQVVRWPLPPGEVTIGSGEDNDIVLPFPGISRRHARIDRVSAGLRISDLESKNGIVMDGVRVLEVLLRPGEPVSLGRATLMIEDARTSDVEVVPATGAGSSSHVRPDETSEDRVAGGGDAAAALRLIRDVEAKGPNFSGRRRNMFLQRCMEVLRAQSLLLCDLHSDGDVEVLSLAGVVPSEQTLEIAKALVPSRQRAWRSARRDVGRTAIIVAGRASHHVVTTFAFRPDPWVEDFITFVAEKLIHAPGGEARQEPPPPAPRDALQLVVPAGMVVGGSESMTRLLRQVAATVGSRLDVLLLGETGTGKELFARMIHASGPTAAGPFVAVNCAAIPGELLEAELFGVQARVATGVDPRPGLFLQANGGSIFLDEIGELPERLQAKLLRVIQEREVLPLGASAPRKIDVRIISASNRELDVRVHEGAFRADLFYRLRGLQFHLPPLRHRKDDIPALVLEFMNRASEEYGKQIRGVSRRALNLLVEHDWPGNVRELESEIRRAVLVCTGASTLQAEHLGSVRWTIERRDDPGAQSRPVAEAQPERGETNHEGDGHAGPAAAASAPDPTRALRDRVADLEREQIVQALDSSGGNRSRAARLLGLTRNGLALKIKRLAIIRNTDN